MMFRLMTHIAVDRVFVGYEFKKQRDMILCKLIRTFSSKEMHFKISYAKRRKFVTASMCWYHDSDINM